MPQVKRIITEVASTAISNASGVSALSTEPKTKTIEVIRMPAYGTPDLLILRVNFGAWSLIPRLRSTRPVE